MSSWAFVLGDSVLGDFVLGAFVLHSMDTVLSDALSMPMSRLIFNARCKRGMCYGNSVPPSVRLSVTLVL